MPIPEAVADMLGKPIGEPVILEIERGAIRRFADAVDDPNPLYHDAEYARNSKYGEMVAPTGFYGWPVRGAGEMERLGDMMLKLVTAGYPGILDGGIEYIPCSRIRAGDILSGYTSIADIAEKATKSGKGMLVLTLVSDYLNQNGEKVLVIRRNILCTQL